MKTKFIFSACAFVAAAGSARAAGVEEAQVLDAFESEHPVAQRDLAEPTRYPEMPRVYSSLPVRVNFNAEQDDESTLESVPFAEPVVERQAVKQLTVGACNVELHTAAVSVTTHERVGGKMFVKDGGLIARATVDVPVRQGVYLSIGTDVDAVLTGTAAQRASCVAALRKGPISLGKLSLATTTLTLRGAGKLEFPMMAIKPGAQAHGARLALDPATNKPLVIDVRAVPLMLESGIYYLKSDVEDSFELDVEPGLHLAE